MSKRRDRETRGRENTLTQGMTMQPTQALYHDVTHCNTLHHTASHYITLRHTAPHCIALQHTATHCIILQHTGTHCTTLHHTASQCITLQHTCITMLVRLYAAYADLVMGWLQLVGSIKYRSLLQKSPIKETIFCKRDQYIFCMQPTQTLLVVSNGLYRMV